VYSRPNFGPSPTGRWAYGNTEGNVIQNNTIGAPYKSGGSAIYLAQVGSSAALNKNTISGNTVQDSTDLKHYLYVFEETTDLLAANILANNVFLGARPSQFYMSRESGHFKTQKNNGILKDN